MPIDFHSNAIAGTYATRTAHGRWMAAMRQLADPGGMVVADIGCGGGIYSRAWSDLGAGQVIGIDFSEQMVADARRASPGHASLSFVHASAADTGLPDASVDIAFSRALLHHLPDVAPAFAETFRILKPGGVLIAQDRTMEDVLQPASPNHLRGWFFERFPRLLDVERRRRPTTDSVIAVLGDAGFIDVNASRLSEPRRWYASITELQDDLRARTGRSILHALSDAELADLIAYISARVGGHMPHEEADFWTVWSATRP